MYMIFLWQYYFIMVVDKYKVLINLFYIYFIMPFETFQSKNVYKYFFETHMIKIENRRTHYYHTIIHYLSVLFYFILSHVTNHPRIRQSAFYCMQASVYDGLACNERGREIKFCVSY